MTHRIGSQLNFSSTLQTNASPFTNYQKWQIELQYDPKSKAPVFRVRDLHGRIFTITKFVIENAAPHLKDIVMYLSIVEQHQVIYQYLRERLALATPHQVHVDDHGHEKVMRFGEYGLKGGVQGERKAGIATSAILVAKGIVLSTKGDVIKGGVLIGTGLAGGMYAYQETDESFSREEYGKKSLSGALSSLVSGGINQKVQVTGTILKMGAQALASAGGSAVSTMTSDAFKGSFSLGNLLVKGVIGGVSGMASSVASAAMGHLTGLIGSAADETLTKISETGASDVALRVLKKASEGALEGAAGQVVANICERKDLGTDVAQAGLLGGIVKGSLAGAEQIQKIQEWQDLSHRKEQAEANLKGAQAEVEKIKQICQNQVRANLEMEALDRTIAERLEQGDTAKINGHKAGSHQEIRKALLQGKSVKWDTSRNEFLLRQLGKKHTLHKMGRDLTRAREHVRSWEQKLQANRRNILDYQAAIETFRKDSGNHVSPLEAKLAQAKAQEAALFSELKKAEAAVARVEGDYSNLISGSFPKEPVGITGLHQRARVLEAPLQPEPVTFVETDCSMQELIQHVVLVHALHPGSSQYYNGRDTNRAKRDPYYNALCCLKAIFQPNGVMGDQIDFHEREFYEPLGGRPSIHWNWNQLVQPHVVGSWENSPIALFEPLSTFEDSLYQKPFGVVPYDTFTLGSYRPSKHSCLLVPSAIFEEAKAYLNEFPGKIISFDEGLGPNPLEDPQGNPTGVIRPIIMNALKQNYPEMWLISDQSGNSIGETAVFQSGGYPPSTYIKKPDGTAIKLMDGQSGLSSQAMREFNRHKRFIGIHDNSITYYIESNGNKSFFMNLLFFQNEPLIVKDPEFPFAAHIKTSDQLSKLVVLHLVGVYQKMLQHDLQTGIIDIMAYYIKEAIRADLLSVLYQMFPERTCDFSIFDFKIMFRQNYIYFLNILENIRNRVVLDEEMSSPNCDLNTVEPEVAFALFQNYCAMLQQCLDDMHIAKKEAARALEGEPVNGYPLPLCLSTAQIEWDKVTVPEGSIEIDLSKNWPLSKELRDYVEKMIRELPDETEKLGQLYRQLSPRSTLFQQQTQKEKYRINIISNTIYWSLVEKYYQDKVLEEEEKIPSVVISKVSRARVWLKAYGLEAEDYTVKVGNCLFDNVAGQLPLPHPDSLQLRQDVVRFMKENSTEYESKPDYRDGRLLMGDGRGLSMNFGTWEEYLTAMGTSQVWGTEIEIAALAADLKRPIVLLTAGNRPVIYNREREEEPIFLRHVGGNHFESCIPCKGLTARDVYSDIKKHEL